MTPALFADLPPHLIERLAQSHPEVIAFVPPPSGRRSPAATAYGESLDALAAREHEPVGVYVHLPFCPVRCLYCACHTTITHDAERIDRYLDTLEREMDLVAGRLGRWRTLAQLHLGGGTPNYLSDSQLIRLMDLLGRRFQASATTTSTIECNPRRTSAGQLELLRGLGFTAISFGIQDLDARVQHAIGRINSLGLVRDVCTTARAVGFASINLDLIYGLPKQTRPGFESTLERIIEIAPDRIRLLPYSHRPASRPHQYAIETDCLPGPGERLTLLHSAVAKLTRSGYHWIGVDCFAREDDELAAAQVAGRLYHTPLGYTSTPLRHVVGLGSSSLSQVGRVVIQNHVQIDAWAREIASGRFPVQWYHQLSDAELARREVIAELLCRFEIPTRFAHALETETGRLTQWAEHGLIEHDRDCIRITQRGRYFLRCLCDPADLTASWHGARWDRHQVC